MSKQARRYQREGRDNATFPLSHQGRRKRASSGEDHMTYEHSGPSVGAKAPLRAKTDNQARYLNSMEVNDITFGLGPAGTGKSYVAVAHAADLIRNKVVERIILTRPAVEAGESIGFLPGEADEKFDPYFAPVKQILIERLGAGHVEGMMAAGRIIAMPLGFIRGHTFKDALVILDEAQNTTPLQMKMFLTRIGEGAKMIINGDVKQKDIPGQSGLLDAVKRLDGLKGIGVITFSRDDIVRHGLVREIVERYECDDEEGEAARLPDFITRVRRGD